MKQFGDSLKQGLHGKKKTNYSVLIIKTSLSLLCLLFSFSLLFGCASSEISRQYATHIDETVQSVTTPPQDITLENSYGNASQIAKGVMIGGAGGAIAGAVAGMGFVGPAAAGGAVFGGIVGAIIERNASLQDRLINRGVNVIVLGDQIRIILHSEQIFEGMTPAIQPQAYSTLHMIADYIRPYIKTSVKVAGYTNATGPERINLALSQEQAESVAKFLQANEINARLIYAVGYGGDNLVSRNSPDWASSDNYRIEITLEKLPA